MTTITDAYGRIITQAADGSWSTSDGGIRLGPKSQSEALTIFNAMAPEGWIDPSLPPVEGP